MKKENNLDIEVRMVSAISHAVKHKKQNKFFTNEEVLKEVSKFIEAENNYPTQMAMIAAASKALTLSDQFPNLSERQLIKKIMPELQEILSKVD